jgi:histidine triad (HIT) family protein
LQAFYPQALNRFPQKNFCEVLTDITLCLLQFCPFAFMKTALFVIISLVFFHLPAEAQSYTLQDFAPLYTMQGNWAAPTNQGVQYEEWTIEDPCQMSGKLTLLHGDTALAYTFHLHFYLQESNILYVFQAQLEGPSDTFRLARIDAGDYIFEMKTPEGLMRTIYRPESDSILEKYLEMVWPDNNDRHSFMYRNTGQAPKHATLNPEYLLRKARSLAQPSVFQKEIDGKLPERIVFQDSLVTVLRPLSAQAPTHLLVIPNRRIPTLNDASRADEALLGHLLLTARDMAQHSAMAETGYRLTINTNEDAGQSAFHLHLHVLGGARTGPMVDAGWRNVQRRLADSTHLTPFEKRALGTWVSKTPEADVTMKWEPELQNRFLVMSYNMQAHPVSGAAEVFEGKAFYKNDGGPGRFKAQWMDSNGDVFPVEGRYDGQEFTTYWGLSDKQQGKTVYRFLDDQTIELTDFRKKGAEWVVFNRVLLRKQT